MSEQQITRVRDVMLTEFDVIDGMLTIEEAIKSMTIGDLQSHRHLCQLSAVPPFCL